MKIYLKNFQKHSCCNCFYLLNYSTYTCTIPLKITSMALIKIVRLGESWLLCQATVFNFSATSNIRRVILLGHLTFIDKNSLQNTNSHASLLDGLVCKRDILKSCQCIILYLIILQIKLLT